MKMNSCLLGVGEEKEEQKRPRILQGPDLCMVSDNNEKVHIADIFRDHNKHVNS